MEYIVEVENLYLEYKFMKPMGFKQWLTSTFSQKGGPPKYKVFQALQDISFKIKKGSTVGIIGENGAGKSTLLRVLAKVYEPDRGTVKVHTDSVSLLTLATGFKSELSGLENIYINGLLLGLSKKRLDEKLEE